MTHTRITTRVVGSLGALFAPLFVFAQASAPSGQSIDKLGAFLQQFIGFIDNYLVPLLFAVAFIVFIFGMFRYFILGGADEEKRSQGRTLMLWGMIGFFVMVSIWGILNLLVNSFGLGSSARPDLPTFGSPSSSASQSAGATLPTAPAGTTVTNTPTPTPAPVNKCVAVGQAACPAGTTCNPSTGVCESNTPRTGPAF
jgi:Type IV secretion system pilin